MCFLCGQGQDPTTEEVVNAALFDGVDHRERVDRRDSVTPVVDGFSAENFDVRVASLFAHLNSHVDFGLGLLEFARLCKVELLNCVFYKFLCCCV